MNSGTVRYATSRRPAFGVRVVLLGLPPGTSDPDQGTAIEETYTDRDGRYTLSVELPSNYVLALSRGQLVLANVSVGDCSIELQGHLADLARALQPNTWVFRSLKAKAQAVLSTALRGATVKSCRSAQAALVYPSSDGENPGILLGSLLAACAVQLHFYRAAGRAYDFSAASKLATSILRRFTVLSPSPGYIVRWLQASGANGEPLFRVNGEPVLIDMCDPLRGVDPTQPRKPSDTFSARSEPSIDEYSGILFGLSWLNQLAGDLNADATPLLQDLLHNIDNYFKAYGYWLIRPCEAPDLTVRGSISGLASYGYDAAVSRALGRPSSDGGHPLQVHGDKLQPATENANANLNANPGVYLGTALGDYEASALIADTVVNFDWKLLATLVGAPLLEVIAAIPAGVVGAAAGPFGDFLSFLPLLPIAVLGAEVAALEVAFDSGNNLWALFSQFIQLGLSAKPDNNANYDRLALAAAGTSFVESSWQTSASRPRLPKDGFTRPLTTAASLWMANVPGSFDDADAILAEFLSLTMGDGFTQGDVLAAYCVLCMTVDVDPALEWDEEDNSYLDPILRNRRIEPASAGRSGGAIPRG